MINEKKFNFSDRSYVDLEGVDGIYRGMVVISNIQPKVRYG